MKKLLFFTLLALTFGCNSAKSKKDTMLNSTLQDGSYKVVSVLGNDITSEMLTLDISESGKSISGFSGCNNYFGTVTNQTDGSLFSGIGATKKFCPDTMETEKSFLNEMSNVTQWESKDNTINLNDSNGDTIIVLKK